MRNIKWDKKMPKHAHFDFIHTINDKYAFLVSTIIIKLTRLQSGNRA
jgi:hypothetical protein